MDSLVELLPAALFNGGRDEDAEVDLVLVRMASGGPERVAGVPERLFIMAFLTGLADDAVAVDRLEMSRGASPKGLRF